MKIKLLLIAVLMTGAILFVGYKYEAFEVADAEVSEVSDADNITIDANNDLEQKDLTVNTQVIDDIGNAVVDKINKELPANEKENAAHEEVLLTSFKRMYKSVGKFNSESFIRTEIESLIQDQDMLLMASEILTSLEKAKSLFGEDQAMARVYAIKMLEVNASLGDVEPLYNTTAELARLLDEQAKSQQEFAKRQDLDLEELVAASLKSFDPKDVYDIPETVLQRLGYYGEYDDKIKRIYANMIGAIFAQQGNLDEAVDMVQQLFKKDT